jgi:hypothetical protein
VHDVAKIRVIAQCILHDFAEGLGEKSFVELGYGLMDIFFGGGDTALHVALVHSGGRIIFKQR